MEEKRTGTNEEKVHEINGYKVSIIVSALLLTSYWNS